MNLIKIAAGLLVLTRILFAYAAVERMSDQRPIDDQSSRLDAKEINTLPIDYYGSQNDAGAPQASMTGETNVAGTEKQDVQSDDEGQKEPDGQNPYGPTIICTESVCYIY